ncbi:ParB/RepB/Spo0J family partition protein [Arcobacter aquimarinus]|uniref:ParB/RepB/Spo0J family partition protein n=1 Tax=Arcobacter aquimarinus TaxID=1315211 RepID=UPI003BAE3189
MNNKPDFSKITAATAGKTKTTGISPFNELEISKVYPNPEQPRKQFDDIEELASTIKEHGLLQPITVVKKDDGYMIISGERRYKAHLYNEAKTIKAHIVNVTDEAVEELTLIENIQRNDLTDFETAKHIVKLWESGRYEKKSDLAKKIGKPDSYVSKAFSCLKLDNEILEDIEANKKDISIGVMDEIARVKDKEVQKEVYQKYSDGEITRDDIKEFKEPKKKDENEIYFRYVKPLDNAATEKKQKGILFDLPYELKGAYIIRDKQVELYEFQTGKQIGYGNLIDKSIEEMIEIVKKFILQKDKGWILKFIKPKTVLNDDFLIHYEKIFREFESVITENKEENFPRGNLKKFELEIFGQDGLLYESDIIEASNDNQALKKAYEKYPDTAKDDYYNFFVTEIEYNIAQEKQKFIFTSKNTEDNKSISFEDEGFFYFVNYGSGAKKSFKLGKKYKITIEEI